MSAVPHVHHPLGDPDAYRAIFFEETREHLAAVEAILLRLDPRQAAQDDLNAIFRAVHSIKGSAAMLGCDDMAQLAHLQENLLDLLRKQERAMEAGDVEALLRAGDVLQAQALHHRGAAPPASDAAAAAAALRSRIAAPRDGAVPAGGGAVLRRFAVRLGPLPAPIDAAALATLLAGLAELGSITPGTQDNCAGGEIAFTVALEGTAADLQEVLALVVAPALVRIAQEGGAAPAPAPAVAPAAAPHGDEIFVPPQALRARRAAPADPAPAAPAEVHDTGFIRVATDKVDQLVNLVGELVITEAMLARGGTAAGLADLARHTRDLQEAVLAIRMLPIANVFSRFPRLVHALCGRLGKQVELRFGGESTELDRGLIEKISDPLTHLVRNAVDHGIEPPAERIAAGKPAAGSLRLQATQRGGNVVVEVSDDGRGLDRARILALAAQRGLAVPADADDAQVWQLVFLPGFSTAGEVTELSGRGVGMDVVRRNIQALGGTVDIASTAGAGTTVTVSVPLTLAIVEAMTVTVGATTYVLPLAAVAESLQLAPGDVHALPGQGETLRVREDFLPVLHLARLFPPAGGAGAGDIAVVLEAEGRRVALVVDALVGQQQVVVKSLEANFRRVPGLSGATVMGDGSVALILDVSHLVRLAGGGPAQP